MTSKRYLHIFVIIKVYISCISQAQDDGDLVVTLINPEGKIQGNELTSTNNNSFYAFQGIPFATSPTGTNRFAPPKNAEGWTGIRDATVTPPACVQFHPSEFKLSAENESEDCLFLNVYTPIKPGTANVALPVLVWIHGGAFSVGSGLISEYGPYLFMDHEILVVTINYRLGPLGFLNTADGVIPGNLGLKDQNFALRWVAQNIHLFGGNASEVTISGESAGGVSVGKHLVGPRDGLFRGAVLQSGSAIMTSTYTENSRNYAFDLARLADPSFTSNDSQDLLTLLRRLSTDDLVVAANAVVEREQSVGIIGDLIWTSVIEDDTEDAFITKPMLHSLLTGDYNTVPTLMGYNSEESLYFAARIISQLERRARAADESSLINPKMRMTAENRVLATTELKKMYTNTTFEKDLYAFVKMSSDKAFKTAVIKQASVTSEYAPSYLYQFSFQGNMSRQIVDALSGIIPGVDGVGHFMDINFMWGQPDVIASIFSDPPSARVSEQFVKMWTNFVKYQNPTPERDDLLDNIQWPTVTADNRQYLDIGTTLRVLSDPIRHRQIEEIIDAYYEEPAIIY